MSSLFQRQWGRGEGEQNTQFTTRPSSPLRSHPPTFPLTHFLTFPALLFLLATLLFTDAHAALFTDIKRQGILEVRCLGDFGEQLSTIFGVRICTESDLPEPVPYTRTDAPVRFVVGFTNATLNEVIQQFVSRYTNFTWKVDEANEILRIFPRQGSALDWKVAPVQIEKKTLMELVQREDVLQFRAKGLLFRLAPGGNIGYYTSIPISAKLDGLTAAEALNKITYELKTVQWRVSPLESEPGKFRLLFVYYDASTRIRRGDVISRPDTAPRADVRGQ